MSGNYIQNLIDSLTYRFRSYMGHHHDLSYYIDRPDEFYDDPNTRLANEDVQIGPARPYRSLFLLPILLGLLVWLQSNNWQLIYGMAMFGFVCGLVLVWWRSHYIRFTAVGLEIHHREKTVYCPWTLFNSQGEPWVTNYGHTTILPACEDAVEYIEIHSYGRIQAQGSMSKSHFFKVISPSQIQIKGKFGVDPEVLAYLISHLGHVIGSEQSDSRMDAIQIAKPDEQQLRSGIRQREDDWLEVDFTQWQLPPSCLACGDETEEVLVMRIMSFRRKVFNFIWVFITTVIAILGMDFVLEVDLPYCKPCRKARERRARFQVLKALLISILIGISLYAISNQQLFWLIFFLFPGPVLMAMYLKAYYYPRTDPMQFAALPRSRRALLVRFRKPEDRERWLKWQYELNESDEEIDAF